MLSMVRTEIRVPAGMVTDAGFVSMCATVAGSSGRELLAGGGAGVSVGAAAGAGAAVDAAVESNLRETISATLYFCTEEPTWKLISVSVPPMNLPLIKLPFFSSKESADARDAPSQR